MRLLVKQILFTLTLAALALPLRGQTPVAVAPTARQFFSETTGAPLVGGKLCTYAAGTTTPLATYTSATGTVQNSNPIVLDSSGMATIFVATGVHYKFTLYDATGTPNTCTGNVQWTVDNFSAWGNPLTTLGDLLYGGVNGALMRLPGNTTTTPMYLKSLGSGSAATAPTLAQVQFSDISGTVAALQLPSGWNPVSIPNGGTGQVSAGAAFNALSPLNTVVAATQSGSDCGAKINTADSSLGATAGEIWVNQSCGTTWTTALTLSANHVLRFIQGGTYTLNVGQTISAANVGIVGDGPWTTVLSVNFASGDVFNFTGSGGFVKDIRFVAAVARTGGAYVHFSGIMPGLMQSFSTDGAYIGVEITDSSIVRVQNGVMRNGATTGGAGEIMLDGTGGQNDIYIDNVTMDAPGGSQPPTGIGVYNSGATNITNVDIIHHGTDLAVAPGNGQFVASLYVLNSFFDTAVNGIVFAPTGTGNLDRVRIADSWTSSHSNVGVMLNNAGAGSCGGIMIVAHHSILNASHGLQNNQGCIDVQISGGLYAANGGDGIVVGANVTAFQIQGVRSGNGGGIAGNAQYGISINAGASDSYQIIGNDLRGNTLGSLVDGGTGLNKVISGNLPFSTVDNTGKSVFVGTCVGTANASSTLGLNPLGGAASLTCTTNITSIGAVMPSAAILRNLRVAATTGGKNASSGVFTVMKNTGATALTCTVGVGTTCSDTTDAAAFAVGDVLTVQFTTQASETLANVQASVER